MQTVCSSVWSNPASEGSANSASPSVQAIHGVRHPGIAERERFAGDTPPLLNCVAPDGTFTDEFPSMSGRFVKECDRDISRDLRSRGLLVHQEQYLHDYPFCWRADDDPLIQYPRQSWFHTMRGSSSTRGFSTT